MSAEADMGCKFETENEGIMAIPVKLEVFEGPLDLLLHLIDKNKIDIYDIPIVEITEQYLDYIRQMETEDMNVMSEFLVMAATLIDIKCRMLLPNKTDEEGEEEEDPRAELVQKLLEYKMCKYMSLELKDRQVDAARNLYREQRLPPEVAAWRPPINYKELMGDLTLSRLHEIFKSVMRRQEDKIDPIRSKYGNIEKDEIDIDAKTLYVEAYAREHKQFGFRQLLKKQAGKMEVVVTFLVILELMKTGKIMVSQEAIFGDISILWIPKESDLFSESGSQVESDLFMEMGFPEEGLSKEEKEGSAASQAADSQGM